MSIPKLRTESRDKGCRGTSNDAAGGRSDRSLVAEVFVDLVGRQAISNDALAFEHPAEQVGHMRYLLPPFGPGQLERPSRHPRHPGVAVGFDDVVALQPGLVGDVRPRGNRPPPAWEIALPSVRGRPAERLHLAEVEQRGVLESDSALPVSVIGIDELDPGGQLARLHRHVDMVIFIVWRIRSHASMVLEEESKSRTIRCKLHQIR